MVRTFAATEARRVPIGMASTRTQLQTKAEVVAQIESQSAQERGATYEAGLAMEAGGYLMLYRILDRLEVGSICTIISGKTITISTKTKVYEGTNQGDVLIQIIIDALKSEETT